MIDPEFAGIVAKHFTNKEPKCIVCVQANGTPEQLLVGDFVSMELYDPRNSKVIIGQRRVFFPMTCDRCGFTMLFDFKAILKQQKIELVPAE